MRKLAELSELGFVRANLSLVVHSWKGSLALLVEVVNTCFGIRFAESAGYFALEVVGRSAWVAGYFVVGGHFGADRSADDGCSAVVVVAVVVERFELGPERFGLDCFVFDYFGSDCFGFDRFELVRFEGVRFEFDRFEPDRFAVAFELCSYRASVGWCSEASLAYCWFPLGCRCLVDLVVGFFDFDGNFGCLEILKGTCWTALAALWRLHSPELLQSCFQ